jgi:hypothetical protein
MNTVTELRKLASDPQLRPIFSFLSERRDSRPVTIDRILSATRHKIPRISIVHLAKSLDRLNLCNFVAGRRNFPSRILFYFTPASIGKSALSETSQLERVEQTEAGDTARKLIKEAIEHVSAPEERTQFQVQYSPIGTTFMLPKSASEEDKEALIDFIRQIPAA